MRMHGRLIPFALIGAAFVTLPLPGAAAEKAQATVVLDLQSDSVGPRELASLNRLLRVKLRAEGKTRLLYAENVVKGMGSDADEKLLRCATKSCARTICSALSAQSLVRGAAKAAGREVILELSLFDVQKKVTVRRASSIAKDPMLFDSAMERAVRQLLGTGPSRTGAPATVGTTPTPTVGSVSPGRPPTKTEQDYARAREHFARGDYRLAVMVAKSCTKRNWKAVGCFLLLGAAYRKLGEDAKAAKTYMHVKRFSYLPPRSPEIDAALEWLETYSAKHRRR